MYVIRRNSVFWYFWNSFLLSTIHYYIYVPSGKHRISIQNTHIHIKTNLEILEGSEVFAYTQLSIWTNNLEEAAVTALTDVWQRLDSHPCFQSFKFHKLSKSVISCNKKETYTQIMQLRFLHWEISGTGIPRAHWSLTSGRRHLQDMVAPRPLLQPILLSNILAIECYNMSPLL